MQDNMYGLASLFVVQERQARFQAEAKRTARLKELGLETKKFQLSKFFRFSFAKPSKVLAQEPRLNG